MVLICLHRGEGGSLPPFVHSIQCLICYLTRKSMTAGSVHLKKKKKFSSFEGETILLLDRVGCFNTAPENRNVEAFVFASPCSQCHSLSLTTLASLRRCSLCSEINGCRVS